jgi:hypothetical protein
MPSLCALLLLLSATAWPSGASLAAVVPQADQGLNGGWAIDDGGNTAFVHSLSGNLGTMYSAGSGWARVVFRLGGCYADWTTRGCDGRTALQAYDGVVANVHGQGLHVLGVLTGETWPGDQTAWTANNAETAGGTGDNAYVRAFAQSAAAVVAQHFVGQVGEWEVWNEPNAWTSTDGVGHFYGGSYLYPSNYAWMAQRAYSAIKAATSTNTVIVGGLFAHEPIGASSVLVPGRPVKRGDMPGARRPPIQPYILRAQPACATHAPAGADSGASYLCATYSVGQAYVAWSPGRYPFDDVGQHLYLSQGGPVAASTLSFYLNDLRQAYVAYEGAATPKRTQVTEIGWQTTQVTAQVQASNLAVAFQTLRATAYVGRSYWFQTQDVPEATLYFGLVDTNAVTKPAYSAYQQNAVYTALPRPCTPRPPVRLSVAPSAPGVLQVTVTAGSGNLTSIDFKSGTNALITAGGTTSSPGNFSIALAAPSLTFTIRRAQAGLPVIVPLTVTDACGPWPTFVGGGPTSF